MPRLDRGGVRGPLFDDTDLRLCREDLERFLVLEQDLHLVFPWVE